MFPTPHRRKGGSPLLGAAPGTAGPFGARPDVDGEEHLELDDDGGLEDGGGQEQEQPGLDDPRATRDEQLLASVAASSADRTADRIAAFRARRAAAQQRREQLWLARQRGVAARHAARLHNLAERDGGDGQDDDGPEAA